MLGHIFWWLLFMLIGWALCFYSHWLVQQFGRSAWAERNLWGTRNLLLLIGFFVVVLWVLMVFWVFSLSNPADQVDGMRLVK